jgi:hypothetical protein
MGSRPRCPSDLPPLHPPGARRGWILPEMPVLVVRGRGMTRTLLNLYNLAALARWAWGVVAVAG